VLPSTTSRARANTILALTSSPAPSARRSNTASTTPPAATGSNFSPFAFETTGGHEAYTATMYVLFAKQLRDSGLPADVLVGKLKKDISFAPPGHDCPSDYGP
jgi:hypothetical protein